MIETVVFPGGGFIYGDDCCICSGDADRVVAMAHMPVDELLAELRKLRL